MKNHPLLVGDTEVEDERYQERAEKDVGSIYVYKVQAGGQPVLWSRRLMPHELPNLDALREQYGGGHWEIAFRGADDAGIIAKVRYQVGGPEKNPDGSPVGQPSGSVPGASIEAMLRNLIAAQSIATPPAAGSMFNAQSLALIIPAVLAYLTESQRAQASRDTATQQLMAHLAASQGQGQVQLIQALMGNRGSENNGIALQESFMKGLETMGQVIGAAKKSTEEGTGKSLDWLEVVGSVLQGLRETVTAGAKAIEIVNGPEAAAAVREAVGAPATAGGPSGVASGAASINNAAAA